MLIDSHCHLIYKGLVEQQADVLTRARARGDLVVDLARQEPQRQADDAGRMRQHALDGEMRLAGVGGTEHGGDAAAGSAFRIR